MPDTDIQNLIFSEPDIMVDLLGPHDENLKELERLHGSPIRVLGTELRYQKTSSEPSPLEKTLHQLVVHVRKKSPITPEVVRHLYESCALEPDEGMLEPASISIPQALTQVFGRTRGQTDLIRALAKHQVVFALGPAGTGKTYLAIAQGISEVLGRKKRKLILTRPVVESGENLGFLPGDLEQKLDPYVKPLFDALESLIPGDLINRLQENRVIELSPLAYMRGRSLRDSCIILDEAQNTTPEQMKMFLTRLGENTKAVITGDLTQTDLPRGRLSGLQVALEVVRDIPGIAVCQLHSADVVRSPLVRAIVDAYSRWESGTEARQP